MDCDLVVESRRCTETRRSIVRPEHSDESLLGRSLRGRDDAVASDILYLVVGRRVFGARHVRRRRCAKLAGRLQDEWFAFRPVRPEREGNQADRILPPMTLQITRFMKPWPNSQQ